MPPLDWGRLGQLERITIVLLRALPAVLRAFLPLSSKRSMLTEQTSETGNDSSARVLREAKLEQVLL